MQAILEVIITKICLRRNTYGKWTFDILITDNFLVIIAHNFF